MASKLSQAAKDAMASYKGSVKKLPEGEALYATSKGRYQKAVQEFIVLTAAAKKKQIAELRKKRDARNRDNAEDTD